MTSNEKYKKALEKAKEALNDGTISRNTIAYLQDIFPELKESEDEESKKWILECLYDGLRKSDEQFKGQFKAAIAWLEKQGESTLIEEIKRRKEVLLSEKEKALSISENLTLGGRIAMLEELLMFANEKQE